MRKHQAPNVLRRSCLCVLRVLCGCKTLRALGRTGPRVDPRFFAGYICAVTRETHPGYDELEQFLLRSPTLGADRQREIANHLRECERCADRQTQIAEFHEAYGAPRNLSDPSRALRILNALRMRNAQPRVRTIELHPLLRKSRIPGEKPDAVALAARDTDSAVRYATVGTLVSDDESTVLHLLRDHRRGGHILQVHSDTETDCLHALVSFDKIEGEYVTDATGEAVIPLETIPPVRSLRAGVRPVSSLFPILPQHLEMLARIGRLSLTNAAGGLLRISQEDAGVRIEPADDLRSDEPVRILACVGESDGLVVHFEGEAAFVPSESFICSRAIALY